MTRHWTGVVRWLDQVKRESDTRGDPELLGAFLRYGDGEAFARLVRRHGPMVHGVCRRVLGQTHDVEDAFQATFLVLLRKAASLHWHDRLGPWLHGVAFRTALKARGRRNRSRLVEQPTHPMTPEPTTHETPRLDEIEHLDAALLTLPERYRLPLVLCELQGLSRRDAARSLKLPEGTLSSRLARGRQLLRQRLVERGVALSAAGLLTLLVAEAKADLPLKLVGATVRTATSMQAGQNVTSSILTLTEGVVKSMFLSKLKVVSAALAVLVILGCLTTGTLTMALGQDGPPTIQPPAYVSTTAQPTPPPYVAPPAMPQPQTGELFYVRVRVLRHDKGGKPIVDAEPQLVTYSGRAASFLVGGEKAVTISDGKTKEVKHVPFGTQITVTPQLLDPERARLSISASLDRAEDQDGFEYCVVGNHVNCMKTVRLGEDLKVVLQKRGDGTPERWMEIGLMVGVNSPASPQPLAYAPPPVATVPVEPRANPKLPPPVAPAPTYYVPVQPSITQPPVAPDRSYCIEAKLQEASTSNSAPETLVVPRVTTWAGVEARAEVGNQENGKSNVLSFVVNPEKGKNAKLRVFLQDRCIEKEEGFDSKSTASAVTFTKSVVLGDTEKMVITRHLDKTPRVWLEVKVTEAPADSAPVMPPTLPAVYPPAALPNPVPMPNGTRGLQLRSRTAADGEAGIELHIGDVHAEGTRFQIGSGEQAYTFVAVKNGMAVKGPAVQTICTEMVFNGGLTVKTEPFTTKTGQLRASCRSDHPGMVLIEWGDAQFQCSKLTFKRGGEECSLIAGSGEFILMRKKDGKSETLLCKELALNFELDTVAVNGAAGIKLSKQH